ncbi:unnamed protein product [Darwinula stevensoni]|uniref:SHSP domain-containing protein n=1 Tax=Darwinula stevensoni TaxID=69355 RepID=A0A7R9AAC3_9CRUS|nr:unnamed protein product [Darwinula stevensoni]CAG0898310.1 unnamed protein product [Darwinula stevensoni]
MIGMRSLKTSLIAATATIGTLWAAVALAEPGEPGQPGQPGQPEPRGSSVYTEEVLRQLGYQALVKVLWILFFTKQWSLLKVGLSIKQNWNNVTNGLHEATWPHRTAGPPSRVFDEHFALGLSDDDLLARTLHRPIHDQARRSNVGRRRSGMSEVVHDEEKFQVTLDVQHFSPSEIQVKTSGDWVVVEAKHDEKRDEHGWVSRHFQRRYHLPPDVRPEDVQSSLSSDGVLTIIALKRARL